MPKSNHRYPFNSLELELFARLHRLNEYITNGVILYSGSYQFLDRDMTEEAFII